jgi:hypothetical protein
MITWNFQQKEQSCEPCRPDITHTSALAVRSSNSGADLPSRPASEPFQPIRRENHCAGEMYRPMRELDDLVSQVQVSFCLTSNTYICIYQRWAPDIFFVVRNRWFDNFFPVNRLR